jgi:hypothetical protein
MTEPAFLSDQQASLLDAQALAAALAERYQLANEHCQDNQALQTFMQGRMQTLASLRERLGEAVQQQRLLPKDAHGERDDIMQLLDRLRGLVDDQSYHWLRSALADQEETLAEHLDNAKALLPPELPPQKLVDEAVAAAEALRPSE